MIIQTTLICLTSGKSNQRWLYSGCLGSLLPGPQPLGIGWMLNIRYGQKLSPFWGKLSNIFIFYRPPYNHYQASSDLGWSCWCALRRWERQTQECPGVFDALPYLPFGSSTLSFDLFIDLFAKNTWVVRIQGVCNRKALEASGFVLKSDRICNFFDFDKIHSFIDLTLRKNRPRR